MNESGVIKINFRIIFRNFWRNLFLENMQENENEFFLIYCQNLNSATQWFLLGITILSFYLHSNNEWDGNHFSFLLSWLIKVLNIWGLKIEKKILYAKRKRHSSFAQFTAFVVDFFNSQIFFPPFYLVKEYLEGLFLSQEVINFDDIFLRR